MDEREIHDRNMKWLDQAECEYFMIGSKCTCTIIWIYTRHSVNACGTGVG